ncbi:S26 family signal peptidase [Saliphagus sp. LR7]|uniref:S26 family signal peptidase n=1 Tax=Saliphagus sp. LR7 TaxID=2282654 RepID=UPI000DF77316|nr:S26 family signal peptidase [Saliphagus sp. LR7]
MNGPGSDDPPEETPDDRSSASNSEPTAESGDGKGADRSRPEEATANGTGAPVAGDRSADGEPDAPERESTGRERDLEPTEAPIRWFLRTDNGTVVAIRDVASSVAIVALIGLVLFGVSGIWPPMVAVESGSMEPNMQKGDLVFIAEEGRFVGDGPIGDTGVVSAESGTESGHEKFGQAGDVIVFRPDGSEFRTPVIHRAHFWVEPGENWVDEQANPDYLNGATTCEEVVTCPAGHAGFVTKGDANDGYDQVMGTGASTDVVRPAWIQGKAMFRVPWLGHVRLAFDDLLATGPTAIEPVAAAEPSPAGSTPASVGTAGLVAGTAAVGTVTVTRRRLRN